MFARLSIALFFLVPAPSVAADLPTPAAIETPAPAAACPPVGHLAQFAPAECCKAHKGICGCRAGKIVCCDGSTSKDPGCTCHGEDGFVE